MTVPRVYPIPPGWKIFLLISCTGILAFGLCVIGSADKIAPQNPFLLAVMAAPLALFGLYGIVDTLKSRVVLTDDRIEVIDLRGTRGLNRANIAGRRRLQPQSYGAEAQTTIILLPKNGHGKPLKIPSMIRKDATLLKWLFDFPDLDAADYDASLAEIEKTVAHGRAGEIAAIRQQIRALTTITWIDFALIWFCPYGLDVTVAVAALLPITALLLVARYPALVMLDQQRNSARPNILVPLMLPGLALMLRVLLDVHIVTWQAWVLPTFVLALLMTAAAGAIGRRTSRGLMTLIPLFLLLLPYGYSVLALANSRFDHASPQQFYVPVLNKGVTSGKGSHPEFTIAAWGPMGAPAHVPVSLDVYRAISVGGRVRVDLYAGAFKLPWYKVGLP